METTPLNRIAPESDLFFRTKNETSVVYLLHFYAKVGGRASHYIGYTTDLNRRLREHRRFRKTTNRCAFTRAANNQKIPWTVAVTWKANRSFERYLKQQKNAKRFCPLCHDLPFI
jgi:predicted GIY-YIG superfamily endonuclease